MERLEEKKVDVLPLFGLRVLVRDVSVKVALHTKRREGRDTKSRRKVVTIETSVGR